MKFDFDRESIIVICIAITIILCTEAIVVGAVNYKVLQAQLMSLMLDR